MDVGTATCLSETEEAVRRAQLDLSRTTGSFTRLQNR
jgi:hypothetical protein